MVMNRNKGEAFRVTFVPLLIQDAQTAGLARGPQPIQSRPPSNQPSLTIVGLHFTPGQAPFLTPALCSSHSLH